MIPFATNYTGFSSYGHTRYPSLKPGNLTQDQKIIYEDTKRQLDHMKFYNNFKNLMSTYKQHFVDTVVPSNYQKSQRAASTCLLSENKEEKERCKSLNKLKELMNQEAQEPENKKANSTNCQLKLLKSGVEHWKSMYNTNHHDGKEFSYVGKPDWAQNTNPFQGQSKLGHSEYKTKYGHIGQLPTDIMNTNTTELMHPDDELRQGTTQCTKHIPGYTGYIPAAKTATLAYEHGKGLSSRTTIIKQNILENQFIINFVFEFLLSNFFCKKTLETSNYCGYVPKNTQNLRGKLRPKCFSTQGETFS